METLDPDSDLGPVLARVDAPQLFATIESVGRRLGVKPPGQVRLTYLPCCGVVAWGGSRALIIGLPLFRVLTQGELRAIVAHELAHLARGDATRAARSARFVEAMELAMEREGPRLRGPLGAWARFCLRECSRLIEPVARSQEARADRLSAAIAGGSAASSALVKVAVVQPLFRELLEAYDPTDAGSLNLYAFFRAFWYRLPAETHTAMRLSVLTRRHDDCRPRAPSPARPHRGTPGVSRPRQPQRRLAAGHHVPGRSRDLRADAAQPALRHAGRRAQRLPPGGDVRALGCHGGPAWMSSRPSSALAGGLRYWSKKPNVSARVWSISAPPQPCPAPTISSTRPGTPAGGHGVGQLDRLGVRDQRVLRALEGQHRRIVLGDIRPRRGLGRQVGLVGRRRAQEIADQWLGDLGDVLGAQVGRSEVVDDRLDAGVGGRRPRRRPRARRPAR